jgi:6-phosphogluconolactonase (cycloisomerase 2 family)
MSRSLLRMLVFLTLTGALGAAAASASGAQNRSGHAAPAVFVQTNDPAGNEVVVYDRSPAGLLSPAGTYATGGKGGVAAGAVSDTLASQGSLLYDGQQNVLIGVNAGSDSVYVFDVDGDRLSLSQVVPSGGSFPASVTVHGNLLYVLNAGGDGNVNGFRIAGGKLHPLPGSTRALGLGNANPPFFHTSPGQVGFTPDGARLIVTTKGSTNAIDVFPMRPNGRPSAAPIVNQPATPVPFTFTFQPGSGRLVDGEAGQSTLTTYAIQGDGTLADPRSLADGQAALCWITRVGGYYYVSNTGSNTVSGYRLAPDGTPSLVGPSGVVATTEAGTIDSAAAADSFLYVQTGLGGTVDEFRVESDGTLTLLATVTGLPPGMEGIAAS